MRVCFILIEKFPITVYKIIVVNYKATKNTFSKMHVVKSLCRCDNHRVLYVFKSYDTIHRI